MHRSARVRFVLVAAAFPAILAPSAGACAQDAAAVERGKAVVEKWCRDCHVPNMLAKKRDMAPPFQEIARKTGYDQAAFRAFLDADHFPMTTFRLFDNEKDDVAAYLASLVDK